jgi:hypothetical protein
MTPSDPIKFISRFQRFKIYSFIKNNSAGLIGTGNDLSSPLPPIEDFRWDSQLFPLSVKPKPRLQAFFEKHNHNVRAFQALLDDPPRVNFRVLNPLTYRTILQTDSYLHSAVSFVAEIKSLILELQHITREQYIHENLSLILRPFSPFLVVPEYCDNYQKQACNLSCERNQWIQTDSNWQPIPATLRSSVFTLCSLTHSKSHGILTEEEAIVMAFLELDMQWNQFNFRVGDTYKVQIDTMTRQVKVECMRWGKYCTQKDRVMILPRTLNQPVGMGSQLFFCYGSWHDTFFPQELILHRCVWIEYPWRRARLDLACLSALSIITPPTHQSSKPNWREIFQYQTLMTFLGPFLRVPVTLPRPPQKFWYLKTFTGNYASIFEEAAHHVRYNRISQLETLLEAHPELVVQQNQVHKLYHVISSCGGIV